MGDLNASEESGSKGHIATGDGAGDPRTNGRVEKPKTNGLDLTPQKSTKKEENTPEQTKPECSPKRDVTSLKDVGVMSGDPRDTKPDQPTATPEDKATSMLSLDQKEAAAVSDGPNPGGKTSPLGSILKGSPFEQIEKKGETSKTGESVTATEPVQYSEQQATGPSTPMRNGKPKEVSAQKGGLQSKTKMTSRPSAIGKKSAAQPATPTMEKPENKPHTSTLAARSSPRAATMPSKQPISKKTSPKSAASKESNKEALKDAKKTKAERSIRSSVAPKAPTAASKPAQKPGKKTGPTSPPSFTKPRPKSPTRPVRLPGSATAPTAASAAKLDPAPVATGKPRDRVLSNPTSLRQKSARASLPAGPKPIEKAKDKVKSRLSTASSKAPEGSFLDRMMRPTQSSSQKTHEKVEVKTPPKKTNGVRPEKVEVKTPPKKTNGVRPKSKSDASDKAKSDLYKADRPRPKETAPQPPVQVPVDSSETSGTKGANSSTDEAAPTSAAPTTVE